MRGARSAMSEACGGAGGALLDAELLGDEAEHARAFVLIEALALTSPAVEFESLSHGSLTQYGGARGSIYDLNLGRDQPA